MPEVASTTLTKIYENTNVTVKARIDKSKAASIGDVTFKFLKDGEQFGEKVIPMRQGTHSGDDVIVSHVLTAPAVPDGVSSYFLDYHYFYKVKSGAGAEVLQNFPPGRIQVFPRVAQLKVTDKDGKAFPNFEFMVEQDGRRSELRKTVASNTTNARGETIPAGSCEFNLELFPNFRIVPSPPYEIAEEVVGTGRRREIKGAVGFRAVFVAPKRGDVKQYVNYDVENLGQTGIGHAVTIEVGVHPEDRPFLTGDNTEVHFRVTYGPAEEPVLKSGRDDAKHPTKVTKVSDADATVTIEEKEAKKKYEGKVKLKDGAGKFVVGLGKAGGDTCVVEISGNAKFLTESLTPDATLSFENWRRVDVEFMMPDVTSTRAAAVLEQARRPMGAIGRQIFVEFNEILQTFEAEKADYGTLAPQRFLGDNVRSDELVYILSGRNWRKLPEGKAWSGKSGKTLHVAVCDSILKFRKDTDDETKGTTDFSGTVTEPRCSINMQEKLGGLFMPFSGYDAEDGVSEIELTADISKDDEASKYTGELEIVENRESVDSADMGDEMSVILNSDTLDLTEVSVTFKRLPAEGTEDAEQTPFNPELSDHDVQTLQDLVDEMFASIEDLLSVEAKVVITISAPADTGHDEDKCFAAVKDKLQELFDAKKEFVYHPGLDRNGEPRTGTYSMQEISIGSKCTVSEWHFELPAETDEGDPGPGSWVGPEKTRDRCPVKIAFSAQLHELSKSQIDGNLIAWVCDASTGPRQLVRLLLRGFQAVEDPACLAHGHGADGFPGDCLEEKDAPLCAECIQHERSRDLTRM